MHRRERIRSECEQIIIHAHAFHLQRLRPDRCDRLLQRRSRGSEFNGGLLQVHGDVREAVAVDLAGRLRPDVVVMDINMPFMNGIEATARIKTRHPDIVVIGLSVQYSLQAIDALLEAGAAAILSKEQAADDLYRTIAQCLG